MGGRYLGNLREASGALGSSEEYLGLYTPLERPLLKNLQVLPRMPQWTLEVFMLCESIFLSRCNPMKESVRRTCFDSQILTPGSKWV